MVGLVYMGQFNFGVSMGNGDGEIGNVLAPASPDGNEILAAKIPAGTKITPISSPNG